MTRDPFPTGRRLQPRLRPRLAGSPELASIAVQATALLITLLFNVLVARAWGATGRGELAVVFALSGVAAQIGGIGISDALVAHVTRFPQTDALSWTIGTNISTAAAGALVSIAATLAGVISWRLVPVIIVLASANHLVRSTIAVSLLSQRWWQFHLARASLPTAVLVAALCGLALEVGSPAVGIAACSWITAWALSRRAFPSDHFQIGWIPKQARPLAYRSAIVGVLHSSVTRLDIALVAVLASTSTAGVYAVALAIGEIALTAAEALALHALHRATGGRKSNTLASAAAIAAFFIVALSVLPAHVLATSVLGPEFSELSAVLFLLAPGITAMAFARVTTGHLMGTRRANTVLVALASGVIAQVAAQVTLVPRIGVRGAAVGATAGYVIVAGILGTARDG